MGLCICDAILTGRDTSQWSVALVERQQPCAGATGAGQGYIWMAHRQPGAGTWDLAVRSCELWRALKQRQQLAPGLEWQVRVVAGAVTWLQQPGQANHAVLNRGILLEA